MPRHGYIYSLKQHSRALLDVPSSMFGKDTRLGVIRFCHFVTGRSSSRVRVSDYKWSSLCMSCYQFKDLTVATMIARVSCDPSTFSLHTTFRLSCASRAPSVSRCSFSSKSSEIARWSRIPSANIYSRHLKGQYRSHDDEICAIEFDKHTTYPHRDILDYAFDKCSIIP